MKKPVLVYSIVFFFLGVVASWAISHYYSSPAAYNRGIGDERKRCTKEAKLQIRKEEIEKQANTLCLQKLSDQGFDFEKKRQDLQQKLYECSTSMLKLRAHESTVRNYFARTFDRLVAVTNQAKELAGKKELGDQEINGLNEKAKSVLHAMAVGREKFLELSIALNSEAQKSLHDLEVGRMSASDLRDRLVPLADSRKEKEALVDNAMNKLAAQ